MTHTNEVTHNKYDIIGYDIYLIVLNRIKGKIKTKLNG